MTAQQTAPAPPHPDTQATAQSLVTAWARSRNRAERTAAAWAIELSGKPPGTPVETIRELTARYNTTTGTAARSRALLVSARILRHDPDSRRYYLT
jgi:hypothetical protein